MRNGEENNKSKRKKRKKGKDCDEICNGVIAADNKIQFSDDKQERKTKKRKHWNDLINVMQEAVALKSRNRSNGAEVIECKSNEGGSSLVSVKMGDANTHSCVTNNDDQGKKMKNKEKLTSKRIEDSEFKSYVSDPALAESTKGDHHLVKINMGDVEHASVTEVDNHGKKKKQKKMKKKEKLTNKSKRIGDSEFKSNGCDPALAEINESDPYLVKSMWEILMNMLASHKARRK